MCSLLDSMAEPLGLDIKYIHVRACLVSTHQHRYIDVLFPPPPFSIAFTPSSPLLASSPRPLRTVSLSLSLSPALPSLVSLFPSSPRCLTSSSVGSVPAIPVLCLPPPPSRSFGSCSHCFCTQPLFSSPQSVPSDLRQVTIYGEADIVITAHAGSMTNAQFMKPRSVLIEVAGYHKKVRAGSRTTPGQPHA